MVDLGVRLLGIIGASVSEPSMHLCGKWEIVCIHVYSCMHGIHRVGLGVVWRIGGAWEAHATPPHNEKARNTEVYRTPSAHSYSNVVQISI